MERSRKIFHKIASVSQKVVDAANEYADCKDCNSVSQRHFQLERDMRRISVACGCLANIQLIKPQVFEEGEDSGAVDGRVRDWLATDGPQECLNTPGRMESLLRQGTSSWMPRIFHRRQDLAVTQDRIEEAVNLFNSCKGDFHFFFSTDIWNKETAILTQQDVLHSSSQKEPLEPRFVSPAQAEIETTVSQDLNIPQNGHVRDIFQEGSDNGNVGQSLLARIQADVNDVVPGMVHGQDRRTVTQRRHEMMTGEQRKEQEKKFEEILKWLDGLNCAEKQDATLLLRQEDTCKWFFDTRQYKMWRDCEAGFLWLRGKPGAGKSVLASFAVDSFKKTQREGEALVFFYCDSRNERSTSSGEAMRSILSQLLRQIRSVDLEQVFSDLIKAKEWGGGMLSNAMELAGFASRVAGLSSLKPLVIVDALDECKDARKLIQALVVIRDHVRLFVTSRPLHVIMDELSDTPFVSMEEMADRLSADIELHVTRELDARQRLRDLDSGFKMEIRTVLCNKADGMFRWVQCSIDTLDRCVTRKEVRKALHSLPKGLDETYERILLAIDVETLAGQLAQRALVWLVVALRPLQLSEIMEALTIDLTMRSLDSEIGPMHKGALLDACGSLVNYTKRTGIIILSHSSVKEYLMGELTRTELQRYRINLEHAHLQLLQSCMCYISICLERQGSASASASNSGGTGAPSKARNQPHSMSQPLLDYALDDALDHFRYLGSTFQLALKDVTMLAKDIERHAWIWDHVYTPARWETFGKVQPHWPTSRHDLLYILVAFAPNSFMNTLLRRTVLRPKEGTNPLVYAAYLNKDEHAQTLLSRGARLNARGWETVGYCQSLPIEVAFQNRNYAMVTRFVEEGSTVPPQIFVDSFFRRHVFPSVPSLFREVPTSIAKLLVQTDEFAENINNCLNEAARRGMKTNQLLVFRDTTEQDLIIIMRRFIHVANECSTPNFIKEAFLRFAVSQGYFTATQYLLTLGAPLPSDLFLTLHRLSGRWKTARMIQFLLDSGADALVRVGSRDSVLHAVLWLPGGELYHLVNDAEEDDILEAAKILIDCGCDPLEADSRGNTPLRIAVERGYVSVTRYLLSFGSPLPPDLLVTLDRRWSRWSTPPMIRLLVEGGVDVSVRASGGYSLLHVVLECLDDEKEALEAVTFLVGQGCNPLEVNHHGYTPLHFAVEQGYVSVSRYLLTLGARIPPNLLILGCFRNASLRPPMIRLLLENGLDILAKTSSGDSMLHIALRFSLDDNEALAAVKTLIDHGCDPFHRNLHGSTPLHTAITEGHIAAARHLLTLGTPLPSDLLSTLKRSRVWADQSSWWTARVIRFLVENGVDVHASDGDSPLHMALRSFYNDNETLEAVNLLVGHGCDPIATDAHGNTPLRISIGRGHVSVTRYLLTLVTHPPDLFAGLGHHNQDWIRTPPMLRLLVENGFDVHAFASSDEPALHVALRSFFGANADAAALEAVRLLVSLGCDPFEVDPCGYSPLHIAVEGGLTSVAQYLLTLGARLPLDAAFVAAKRLGWCLNANNMHFLVENGANTLGHDNDGDTLLHAVLWNLGRSYEALEVAQSLVKRGCDPMKANPCGKTPLHFAIERGNIPVSRYLLSLGVPLPSDLLVALPCWSQWGTLPMIRFLIESGVSVLAHASDGASALHRALQCSNDHQEILDVVKVLVGHGCDPLEVDASGHTPLHIAVELGNISATRYLHGLGAPLPPDVLVTLNRNRFWWVTVPMLQFLVQNGVNVRAHASDGDSVLHIALRCSDTGEDVLDVVQLLIGHGCDPFEANPCGHTPLRVAVERGNISAARYLRSLGAPLPPNLLVALNPSCYPRWSTAPMVHFLVENRVNVLEHASDGDSVLQIALWRSDDLLEVVKLLISHGRDPLKVNPCGQNLLHTAIEQGHISVSRYFLSLGASLPSDLLVTLKDRDQSQWSTISMIHFLVENGVSVVAHASNGDSVLHIALRCTNTNKDVLDVVKLLIGYGCDPHKVNHRGHTPLHVAVERGKIYAARHLLQVSPCTSLPPDLLATLNRDQARWCTAPAIYFLIEHGVDVLARASDGNSVLHIALQCTNTDEDVLEAVKLLISHGCDPLEANSRGETPLHIAAAGSYVSVARYLLTQGANVLTTASKRDTVLHFATRAVRRPKPDLFNYDDVDGRVLKTVKFFVGQGRDPSLPNDDGKTPLHSAVHLGRIMTIKYLLSLNIPLPPDILFIAIESDNDSGYYRYIIETLVTSGCDTQTPNSEGDTPVEVAIKRGKVDVVKYLLSVESVHKPSHNLKDLLSAAELAPPSVRSEIKGMLSDRRTRSESPELPPAKRVRHT